ncbi:hypothetical protein VNO77_42596 [Canavalia gladiata]|uniref:MADS-box domain-containing protein n=1 Tax=Canavalia gladiata TaxID=3824 RepID=A0AAN9JSJ4_CANGL
MGRPKLTLKPIENGRDRGLAFKKGKKGLMKKISEFSTTCVVNACMIIYDGNGDAPPMTWPQDPTKVHSIIEKYECAKNEKPPKNFALNDYFVNRKNMVEFEISKVRKAILKIKYPTWHPNFNSLGEEEMRNLITMLDNKLEACHQRMKILKHNHPTEANFNFMLNRVLSGNDAPNSCLNFMPQDQLVFAPMKSLNDNNLLASYRLNVDRGFGSQSPMLHYDPNLMQLMTKNNRVLDITNQVNVPLDHADQIGAYGNSTSQFSEPLDYFSQLGETEDFAIQPGESISWTNFGRSTLAMDGSEDNPNSSVCNYNKGVESMQPNNNVPILQNIASQYKNMQRRTDLPTLFLPPLDEFQIDDYNNMLQTQLFNLKN